MQKIITEMAKISSQAVEVFLHEYCGVNNVKEEQLKDLLILESDPTKGTTCVKEKGVVIFQSCLRVEEVNNAPVVTVEIRVDSAKYPKTFSYAQEQKNGRNK